MYGSTSPKEDAGPVCGLTNPILMVPAGGALPLVAVVPPVVAVVPVAPPAVVVVVLPPHAAITLAIMTPPAPRPAFFTKSRREILSDMIFSNSPAIWPPSLIGEYGKFSGS